LYTISVQLTSINAEKLATTLPPKVEFNVNLTLPSGEPIRKGNQYILPFTFTVSSLPPIVQIVLRGNALVIAKNENELKKLDKDVKEKKIPPPIIQAIFTNAIADSILISRSLGIPPPVPGISQLQQMKSSGKLEKKGFGQESVI